MVKSAYIHIPFCKSKCKYCSFVSFPKLQLKEQYLNSLLKEIKFHYNKELLRTLYIGGGTPSLLDENEIKEITEQFNIDCDTEITVELNPETITEKYLNNLRKIGVNRLSYGCQTFNDRILKLIGRRHNSKDVENCVEYAHNVGFENVSLDFIYGLPEQTCDMFENDLKKALELDIAHISLYGLKIDDGCYFSKHMPNNLPDEDLQADMYLKAVEILSHNGFEHYEVSNFSKKGYNSRHNLNYWKNNSYYGFGAGAHGYVDGIRYSNYATLEEYIKNPTKHEYVNKLSKQEILEEEIFLGFRKSDGIDVEKINSKFKIDFNKKYKKILDKYLKSGHLARYENGYKLTLNGVLVSNTILSEFID